MTRRLHLRRPHADPACRPGRVPPTDHGQAVPLVLGVVAVLAVLVAGIGWYGRSLVDAARARTAADAAALAGAEGGRSEAARLAHSNGGDLSGFTQVGDDVVVSVQVGRAHARARAARELPRLPTLVAHGRARSPE